MWKQKETIHMNIFEKSEALLKDLPVYIFPIMGPWLS